MSSKTPKHPPSPTNETRRRLLKGATVGGGLYTVSQWSSPVVQSVSLPAHAASTYVPREGDVQAQGFDAQLSESVSIQFPDP